ncbi:MAG: hypothetical protein ACTSU5_16890 [Promethearchaeota archaeon]
MSEGKVIVKNTAFQKMLMHVLRFGSNALPRDDWVEVMGMCIGRYEGDDVVVVDAVPISHGSHIEVAWTDLDYALFADVDAQYGEQGLFSCGWYHSHPGLNVFFSKVDVRNQLGFQTEGNPKAFGIVFDHTLMGQDGNLGFKTFRLNDPAQGINSDYHEVETVVEPPDDLDFFKIPRAIIEYTHNKDKLFVRELSEEPLAEVEGEEEASGGVEQVDPAAQLKPVVEGFSSANEALRNTFLEGLVGELAVWAQDIKVATSKGGKKLVETVSVLNEGVEDGLNRVKQWFDQNFSEKVEEVEKSVEEIVKEFETSQQEVLKGVQEAIDGIGGSLVETLKNTLDQKIDSIRDSVLGSIEKISSFGAKVKEIRDGIDKQSSLINQISTKSQESAKKFNESGESFIDQLRNSLAQALSLPKDDIQDLVSQKEKLQEAVKGLEDALKSVRDLL